MGAPVFGWSTKTLHSFSNAVSSRQAKLWRVFGIPWGSIALECESGSPGYVYTNMPTVSDRPSIVILFHFQRYFLQLAGTVSESGTCTRGVLSPATVKACGCSLKTAGLLQQRFYESITTHLQNLGPKCSNRDLVSYPCRESSLKRERRITHL